MYLNLSSCFLSNAFYNPDDMFLNKEKVQHNLGMKVSMIQIRCFL